MNFEAHLTSLNILSGTNQLFVRLWNGIHPALWYRTVEGHVHRTGNAAIINQQTFTIQMIQWSAEIQCRRLMPDHNHALTVWQNFTACLCCHPRPSKIWVTLRSSWSTFSSKWVHEKSHNKRQDCKHWILFRFGLWLSRYHSKNWSSGHLWR